MARVLLKGSAHGAESPRRRNARIAGGKYVIIMTKLISVRSAVAMLAVVAFSATAWASLTSSKGTADRIIIRPGYTQYDGAIELRDSATGVVTTHYWGGGRCPGVAAPTETQVNRMLNAHVGGKALSLDYNNVVTGLYGTSRCWDGGTMVW